ncbi:MAG: extracellular solute-binding protein [Actinobacteria bacterium]|nr:extracellular solute-binding protein [Actinomycetota bacterium]MSZ06560.1 extracellular solute-binding protein [Actinomycetota bacterium]
MISMNIGGFMKLHRLGVGLLGVSLAFFGSIAPAQAAGTLTIWVNTGDADAYKAASSDWAAKNNVTLNIIAKCGLGDCGMSKLGPAGAGPDLFFATHDNTGALVKSGVVTSLSSTINKTLYPTAVLQGVTSNYQQYAIPISVANIALATNLSLVPAGAPKTWKELESTATSLITSGKASVGIVTHLDGYFLQPFFDSLGGFIFANKNGSYTNTKQVGLYSKALAKNASLMDQWLAEKLFDKSNTYDGSAFSNGKAPYAIVGPWSIDGLDKAGIKYEISGIPSVNGGTARSFSGVTSLYMNRFAKNKLLAKQYLTEVVQTTAFSKSISISTNSYPANIEAAAAIDKKSVIAKFGAYGAVCLPMPNVAEMGQVWTYWNNAFADWASGKAKFGAAMQSAANDLTTALAKG